jgi:preprotein translocase subunit YajC
MVAGLKQGDRVLTSGGLYGTVVSDKDDGNVFVIKIAEQVKVEVAKSAIASVVKKAREA